MSEQQDLDRNEAATPYKLQKAREKGQVSKSADVVSALVLVVAVAYLAGQGWDMAQAQFRLDRMVILQSTVRDPGGAALWPLVSRLLQDTLLWLAPFCAAVVIAALLGNVLQTGPIFSSEPITADFSRLNPANGFKRIFSARALFDTARACAKLVLLAGTAYYALKGLTPQFYGLASQSPQGYVHLLVSDLGGLGFKMALLLSIIAAVDWMFTRREFAKKMRMSKREVKDEHKQREGDPRVRARMRELRREARKRSQALRQTSSADVVLTNPTHVAIALRYVHGEMDSPQVVAKGAGHLAAAMRQIAARHGIPVVRSPALARRLFKELDVEHHVPPQMFADVARIIVWVFAMRERRSGTPQKAAA
ncbi:EscU/YscU/HrcU family type III secretion system export apparatus switch protein [Acidovorax sp. GBBC 3334]|uniref:EscU/YscU/HrcU family type III secretion system export apparatus switch protein n=1 Tax=Acidovorax sp. GBBC 3334 TaxID=2940496 RepID=UPI0023042FEB|nr:EscU/YscU/HrcU family type III secretion system export apparatus switch protein [Acidovorax sp. GBBC 3334]MDA8456947.1 EscU/YscU/HrcU family type III secretion system export apparatus switch protein [Acidovorax sp. GBBC 3334]